MSYFEQIENINNSNLKDFTISELEKYMEDLNKISNIIFTEAELTKISKPLKQSWITLSNLIRDKKEIESNIRHQNCFEKDMLDIDNNFENLNNTIKSCNCLSEDLNFIRDIKHAILYNCYKYNKICYNLNTKIISKIEKPIYLIEFVKNNCSEEIQQIISERF